MRAGKTPHGHRAPGVGNHRKRCDACMGEYESYRGFDLPSGVVGDTQRPAAARIKVHFRIPGGMTKSVEIEPPDVKSCCAEGISPGSSAKPMGDRQRGWKCRAMDIQNGTGRRLRCGRQSAEEERQPIAWARDVEVFFSR